MVAERDETVKEIEEPEARDALTVRGKTRAELEGLNVNTLPQSFTIELKLVTTPESLISTLVISVER